MSDRAQTEVVGYVLVFSVVVLTVALVTVAGQTALAETRDTQQAANLEAGFAVLAENVDDIVHDGAPSRATELDLSGGRLSVGPAITVTVRGDYTSNASVAFEDTRRVRPLVYRAESGAELVYVNGAVIARGQDGGTVMLRNPRAVFSADRTLLPIINTTLNRRQLRGRSGSVGGESRVLVRAERRERELLNATDSRVELTVEVTSPRADAWQEYLESATGTSCDRTGDTVRCDGYATRATAVVGTRIAISLD